MKLGKSVVSHFLSKVVASVAGFLATFAIARFLGADVLGIYALARSMVVFSTVPTLGISTAATKYISEGRDKGAHVSVALAVSGIIFVVIAAALLVLNGHVRRYVGADVTLLIVLLVFSTMAYDAAGSFMKGEKLVARFGWLTTGEKVGRAVLQIALIQLGYAVGGLLFGHFVSLLTAALVAAYVLDIRPSVPRREEASRFVGFVKFSWVGGLKTKSFSWMDTLVLGFFVSSTLIGVYEVAWTLSSFLVLASKSIRNVVFPEFSDLSGQRQHEEIRHLLTESLQYTGLVIIPGFFGALVVGPRVLKIYSPEFVIGGTVLSILILAQTFDEYGRQFVDVLNAVNRPDLASYINLAFTALNLLLNVLLVYLYGWVGAAVATMLSGTLTLVVGYWFYRRTIGGTVVPYSEIGKQLIAAMGMYVSVFFVRDLMPSGNYATLGLVFAGASLYGAALFALSGQTRQKARYLLEELSN